jgi:hypothetical protein
MWRPPPESVVENCSRMGTSVAAEEPDIASELAQQATGWSADVGGDALLNRSKQSGNIGESE